VITATHASLVLPGALLASPSVVSAHKPFSVITGAVAGTSSPAALAAAVAAGVGLAGAGVAGLAGAVACGLALAGVCGLEACAVAIADKHAPARPIIKDFLTMFRTLVISLGLEESSS
jgi:hypothetical protein